MDSHLSSTTPFLWENKSHRLVLAAVRVTNSKRDPRTGIHHYTELGSLEVIDLASVQGVIGRLYNRDRWAIIDRGGSLAHAQVVGGGGNADDEDYQE